MMMSDVEYIGYIIMKIDIHINEEVGDIDKPDLYSAVLEHLTDKERRMYIEYFYGLYKTYIKNKDSYILIDHYELDKRQQSLIETELKNRAEELCIDNPDELTDDELHLLYNSIVKVLIIISGVSMVVGTIVFGIIEIDATDILLKLNKIINTLFH